MSFCWTRTPKGRIFSLHNRVMIESEMIHGALPRFVPTRRRPICGARSQERKQSLSLESRPGLGEWDLSAFAYRKHRMQAEQAGAPYRPPWPARIEDETPISPRALAECVCEEVVLWLGEPIPNQWVPELIERANVITSITRLFANVWAGLVTRASIASELSCGTGSSPCCKSRLPHLAGSLPSSYASGRELPPSKSAMLNRSGITSPAAPPAK